MQTQKGFSFSHVQNKCKICLLIVVTKVAKITSFNAPSDQLWVNAHDITDQSILETSNLGDDSRRMELLGTVYITVSASISKLSRSICHFCIKWSGNFDIWLMRAEYNSLLDFS